MQQVYLLSMSKNNSIFHLPKWLLWHKVNIGLAKEATKKSFCKFTNQNTFCVRPGAKMRKFSILRKRDIAVYAIPSANRVPPFCMYMPKRSTVCPWPLWIVVAKARRTGT